MTEKFDYKSPRHSNLIPTNDIRRFILLKRLEKALQQSWNSDTVAQFERRGWSFKVPAFGQCTVTTLVVQKYFGGEILKDPKNDHYWNIFPDGREADLSRQQFANHIMLQPEERRRTREYMLDNPKAREISLPERCELLSARVSQVLAKDRIFQAMVKLG